MEIEALKNELLKKTLRIKSLEYEYRLIQQTLATIQKQIAQEYWKV